MAPQFANNAERLDARTKLVRKISNDSINFRWGLANREILFPWWREPPKVRILCYADGSVLFSGGSFGGLQHVITLLTNRPYFYVDFELTTAHRERDPSADVEGAVQLTQLDIMERFDEVWFFGIRPEPGLTAPELELLDRFMAAPKFGGVLVTGDHGDLGKGLAGAITRAGEMRLYPAPGTGAKEANTTLVEGPDENDRFNEFDQFDERPQAIRNTLFPAAPSAGFPRTLRPHPVLCGPDGPIDVLPDHRHEGEALAPEKLEGKRWPTAQNGHQERPYVIARGLIKDPNANRHGQEIGVVSAYNGHTVEVGRIVADSSWHHWFDSNLLGVFRPPSVFAGLDDTSAGQLALKKIESYYLNCGAWLAPPNLQAKMCITAWWSIVWTDDIVQLSPDAPLSQLGEEAIRVLGLRASVCAVTDWVLDNPALKEMIPPGQLRRMSERFPLFGIALEQYVAGGILCELMREVGHAKKDISFPEQAPPDAELMECIEKGTRLGVSALQDRLKKEASLLTQLVDSDFRMELPSE